MEDLTPGPPRVVRREVGYLVETDRRHFAAPRTLADVAALPRIA